MISNGKYVKAGEKLANIKVNITTEQLHQLEQTVRLAEKNLEHVQAGIQITRPVYTSGAISSHDIEQAAAYLEKMNQLYALGAISEAKRDEAAASYEAIKNGASSEGNVSYQTYTQPSNPDVIKNAEIQLKQAQLSLERAKQESSATTIIAPVEGNAYFNNLNSGDDIKMGQPLFKIGSSDNLWIEAYLSSTQFEQVKLGQLVSYEINGYSSTGTVTEIYTPDNKKNITDNSDNFFNNNNYAGRIKVSLNKPKDTILIPGTKTIITISID